VFLLEEVVRVEASLFFQRPNVGLSITLGPICDFVANPFIIYIVNLNAERIAMPYAKYKIISVINLSKNSRVLFNVLVLLGKLISLNDSL
jgi:hypothetical protein